MQECPVCGEGVLTNKVEYRNVQKYNLEHIPMSYSTCDVCYSEIATEVQSIRNLLVLRYALRRNKK